MTHRVAEVLAEQSFSSNLSKSAVRWKKGFSKVIEQLKREVCLQTTGGQMLWDVSLPLQIIGSFVGENYKFVCCSTSTAVCLVL